MQLQTTFTILELNKPISYDSKMLGLGSCFAVHITEQLAHHQFWVETNPFGIMFHPKALENILRRVVEQKMFVEEEVFEHQEVWSCFAVHSEMNQPSAESLCALLNKQLQSTQQYIKETTHIIITLGTAWAYQHIETNQWVANCHKQPQKMFRKVLFSVEQCKSSLEVIDSLLRKINPEVQLIFTVSPVRHIKDGMIENQRSKAHLLTALHSFLEENNENAYYFPAYELMYDELRDYRFYAKDMIHPNEVAVAYIWEKFQQACVSKEVWQVMKRVDEVKKALAHRPFNEQSSQHQSFLMSVQQKIGQLHQEFPQMKRIPFII